MINRVLFINLCLLQLSLAVIYNNIAEELIHEINSTSHTWTAGHHLSARLFTGNIETPRAHKLKPKPFFFGRSIYRIPAYFDAREKWPNCPSIGEIFDQGSCLSCWAVGAVTAMSDRYCIHSNQTKHFQFSANDLLACCSDCGHQCLGGMKDYAWIYWHKHGIVSGGGYGSGTGCRPYQYEPCKFGDDGEIYCEPDLTKLEPPKCVRKCQSGYEVDYEDDLKFGEQPYGVGKSVRQIQMEIMTNGPVEAAFTVYEDFLHYTGGVYRYKKSREYGQHSVRLLGWGVENNTDYWLAANSWGSKWGDKGFFKIQRGVNQCGIEEDVAAGMPRY